MRPDALAATVRAADALQRGNAARVIEVRMRIDDEPDVFGPKPKLADVGVDERRRLRQCRRRAGSIPRPT